MFIVQVWNATKGNWDTVVETSLGAGAVTQTALKLTETWQKVRMVEGDEMNVVWEWGVNRPKTGADEGEL
jgi:hypothetical protein